MISRGGRAFRKSVCSILAGLETQPIAGPIELEIVVFPPDRRRRDIDNVQKALLDALEAGGAYEDDSQIVRLTIEKGKPVKGGRTIVQIKKVPEE